MNFNFPPIKEEIYKSRANQLMRIKDELREVEDALLNREHYTEELLDLLHAVETLIRYDLSPVEQVKAQEKVKEKNRERKYYV